jgi:hypothetical protein
MPSKNNNPISFLSGFVQSREIARVLATIDELSEKGASRTWLMKWMRSDHKWGRFAVGWTATRMWVVQDNGAYVFATGPQGKVAVLTPSGSNEEVIESGAKGPQGRGPIRDLRGIGSHLYACGMARQVYRRDGSARWSRFDDGIVLPGKGTTVAGLNSIDGLSEEDIYAVGFGGEIWRHFKRRWRQIESPTNVTLHRVRVIKKDLAYAGGQKGVLLRGSGDQWEQIPQTTTKKDLWGMEWFNGTLYVSSDSAVYSLSDSGELSEVDMGEITTCGHLHANDGVMWSFGAKHVAWTENGLDWNDQTP